MLYPTLASPTTYPPFYTLPTFSAHVLCVYFSPLDLPSRVFLIGLQFFSSMLIVEPLNMACTLSSCTLLSLFVLLKVLYVIFGSPSDLGNSVVGWLDRLSHLSYGGHWSSIKLHTRDYELFTNIGIAIVMYSTGHSLALAIILELAHVMCGTLDTRTGHSFLLETIALDDAA